MRILLKWLADESGQDMIEYALVAAVLALGSVATMRQLSNSLANFFTTVETDLTNSL